MAEEETAEQYADRRQAQFDQLMAYRPVDLADYAHQPEHDFYGDKEFERLFANDHCVRAGNFLFEHPRVANTIRKGVIRCPERGCMLGEAFLFPLKPSGERTLALTHLRRGESRAAWVNWAYADKWNTAPVWLPSGCRHGTARLPVAWFEEIVALVEGWKHALHTVEQDFALYPEEMRRGRDRRTFHPPPSTWRPLRPGRPVR